MSILKTAAINAPRIDYNPADNTLRGLRIEEQRTNKCQNYNLNPDAGLTNITASAGTLDRVNDAANIPFDGGTVGGSVFHLNNATGSPVTITVTGTTANTNKHSIRVFARFTGTAPTLQLTGAVGAVACNNAYAETKSNNITPGATTNQWQLVVPNGTEVWFLGNQLEEGAFVTSPIETAGAAVTRAADVVTSAIVGTLPNEFSVVFEGMTSPGIGAEQYLFMYSDLGGNRLTMLRQVNTRNLFVNTLVGGVLSVPYTNIKEALADLTPVKVALAVVGASLRISVNGGAVQTIAGTTPSAAFTRRDLGKAFFNSVNYWNGWIKNLTEIPRALSDAELIAESTL